MTFRLLQKSDFDKGFLQLLQQLTTVGEISCNNFKKRFSQIVDNLNHHIYVLEEANKIVSCATLFVEPKFIHECGMVGHIEDVVVDKACRGQNLGKKLIDFLKSEAEKLGCYKILLDCSDKNVKFYEKCDYLRTGAYMSKYLNPSKKIIVELSKIDLVTKFCYDYKDPLILGVSGSIIIGYYLYKKYYEEK